MAGPLEFMTLPHLLRRYYPPTSAALKLLPHPLNPPRLKIMNNLNQNYINGDLNYIKRKVVWIRVVIIMRIS